VINIKFMSQYHLAEFEEIVLLTVSILDGNAYGLSIIEEIDNRIHRKVSLGAIQTVLKRLEEKKFLKSEFGEATKIRGGKRKRYYTITGEGRSILKETKEQRMGLWEAIPAYSIQFS
jgi:PadR family transcriptional regulator PadR